MDADKTSNGKRTAVLEQDAVKELDAEVVTVKTPEIPLSLPETKNKEVIAPPVKSQTKKPKGLILATLGASAIALGAYGYNYWQYASAHESTDNATVTGHIYQVSTKISGTVEQVLVDDNQWIKKGQLLVKLDARDYQTKQLQAQAAIETARRQAQTAQVNIGLASQNAQAQVASAQGNVNSAIASISSAQAAVKEANAGIPLAQAQVAQANLQRAQVDYESRITPGMSAEVVVTTK